MPIQVNQCEYASLIALGYTGSLNSMRRDWEIDQGFIKNNDFYFALVANGYTGAFPDMERDFWCSGGGSFGEYIETELGIVLETEIPTPLEVE